MPSSPRRTESITDRFRRAVDALRGRDTTVERSSGHTRSGPAWWLGTNVTPENFEHQYLTDSRDPANLITVDGRTAVLLPMAGMKPVDGANSLDRVKMHDLEQKAYRDQLTGAGTRHSISRYFRTVAGVLSRNSASAVEMGMLAVDLVGLKELNDHFEPQQSMGDVTLRAIAVAAQRSAYALGWNDVNVFRPGGDEYLITGLRSFEGADLDTFAAEFSCQLPFALSEAKAEKETELGVHIAFDLNVRSIGLRYGSVTATYEPGAPQHETSIELMRQWNEANVEMAAAKRGLRDRRIEGQRIEPVNEFHTAHGDRKPVRSRRHADWGEIIVGNPDNLVRSTRSSNTANMSPEEESLGWHEAYVEGTAMTLGVDPQLVQEGRLPSGNNLGWPALSSNLAKPPGPELG